VLDFVTKGAMVRRPFAVPSGVPKERVQALRPAFDQTMKDPAFLADAERIRAEISPTSGEEMQQLIAEITAPADVRDRAKQAMELNPEDSESAVTLKEHAERRKGHVSWASASRRQPR
jgi:hypothetical protein